MLAEGRKSVRLPQSCYIARVSSAQFGEDPYGYVPTEWICILFVILFSLSGCNNHIDCSAVIHAAQAIYTRLWWIFPTICLASVLEIIGWSARLWSSQNIVAQNPYLIQIVTTIIAPTPLIAAEFVILGQLIRQLGQCYSRLSARWYTIIVCSFDVVALVVQAVGGAIAAGAVNQGESPNNGGHIMLAGIVFQMGAYILLILATATGHGTDVKSAVAITVYMALAVEFVLRFLWDRPLRMAESTISGYSLDRNTKLVLTGMALSSVCVFIRSVYRTIELADRWKGHIIRIERFFDWLDGGMISLAMFAVNVFHPGILIGPVEQWKQKIRSEEDVDERTPMTISSR
ncbi:RTA1-domain-containing protein [Laetiporus sulphureus 93-53]|uniref:RTA1-domain-containing protein n=1 Tax=Laetiporus sulphureus 93-53 TaxID=1314785 RepID=A0A165B682_9APHY|nr:RTA1-domain-containing protein [Laetiporus sulphureus 93-53]KZT00333.1 RTA1-domain-containing protein [Laetiporus sulphureus 93-53]